VKTKQHFAVAWIMLIAGTSVLANNISVTNLLVASVGGGTADIQFDLSWENSWRLSWTDDGGATTVTNWDAAWVFVKYRTAGGQWQHALLAGSGHTATGGAVIDVGSNGPGENVGVFVRRSSEGAGTMTCGAMRLKWDLGANGLGGTNDVDISVHAIEMVYIPEGAFYLGSGGSESHHFFTYPHSTSPYLVTSENGIPAGGFEGQLYGYPVSDTPTAYPKGHAAFYCMKYEITQGQYATFLSYLEPGKATVRYPDYYAQHRYGIRAGTNSTYRADAPDRACNYLSWQDLLGYLDWSCLRPMTEFEFEKACRRTLQPEPNEFAWGDTSSSRLTGFSGVDGSGTETAVPGDANCHYSSPGVAGPVRVGIFAESGSTRHKSGATYYGVMEMSGNVEEAVVNAHSAEGVAFAPDHGDGSLLSPTPAWPTYGGMGWRGGDYADSHSTLCVSHRDRIDNGSSSRLATGGGRGVRTCP